MESLHSITSSMSASEGEVIESQEPQLLAMSRAIEFRDPPNVTAPVDLVELISYITSPHVMDYTTMSDFFMTFRLYSTPVQVLELLLARLFSAIKLIHEKASELGRDTAVRTFVVFRHWISNYFADDFLPDLQLRQRLVHALGEFAAHPYTAGSPACTQIFKQLAKVWTQRLKIYWSVESIDSWPLSAGGNYGAVSIDAAGRRRTLLSFYASPAGPMPAVPEGETRQLGSLIRGGILVNTNPQVAFIRTSPKKHKPNRSRFFTRTKRDEPSMVPLEGNKVDLLALRVLSELQALLAVREQLENPVPAALGQGSAALGPSTVGLGVSIEPTMASSPPMPLKIPEDTVDTLNIGQVLDDSIYESSSTASSIVDLRRSGMARNVLDDISFDRASYVSLSSLSTVSGSLAGSIGISIASSQANSAHTSYASARDSVISGAKSKYTSDDDISLLSELSTGFEMAPCAGFNNRVAAELAAIPDDSLHEDAILVAIQKLEGTYQPKNAPPLEENPNLRLWSNAVRSVPSFVSADSYLYSQAFASATNLRGVSGLAIPQCSTPPAERVGAQLALGGTLDRTSGATITSRHLRAPQIPSLPLEADKEHVPFILALSADTLAEQMTLLERDALEQIDWKELAEVSWSQAETEVNSWLGFLASNHLRGIDVVTARFNLVLGWVRSEVVLCRQASLQARTIQRFIHVAVECEKLQNFATMFQIVLALTSSAVRAKVATALSIIDKQDRETLARLEQLISPLRNFHHLRSAHRRIQFSRGCVPFTGFYLADLLHNNEKPNWVDGKINFAKFKTTSALVRSLLECIEWSHNYRILPRPEVLSKCLYLQSLSIEQLDQIYGS